jgi:hypothetical protein
MYVSQYIFRKTIDTRNLYRIRWKRKTERSRGKNPQSHHLTSCGANEGRNGQRMNSINKGTNVGMLLELFKIYFLGYIFCGSLLVCHFSILKICKTSQGKHF